MRTTAMGPFVRPSKPAANANRGSCFDAEVLARRIDALETKIDRLLAAVERNRGARDAADERLLRTIAATLAGTRFTAAELLRHSRVNQDLADALEAADIDTENAIQLGLLLTRFVGHEFDGWRLERTDLADREGIVYRLQGLQE